VAGPVQLCMSVFTPVVWIYSRATDGLFHLLGLSAQRDDRVTSDDILALTEAGALAGVLARREQQVIANVFELDTRTVNSAMTPRCYTRPWWFPTA
jgi:CBS domain containing-hemolysin-like protein